MFFVTLLTLFLTLFILLYVWFKYRYSYWKRNGIPFIKPTFLIGNMKDALTLKQSFSLYLSDVYNDPKMKNESVVGVYIFNQPALVIRNLDIVKSILIKDFNFFTNRYLRCDPHGDTLGSNNLFFARYKLWREIRTKLSPVFTSGKIKQMYPLMLNIASQLEEHLAQKPEEFESNIKDTAMLFTIDLIATVAFGVNANSLSQPNAEFYIQSRQMFTFNLKRGIEFSVAFFLPKLTSLLRIKIFSKEFSHFLRSTINHVMTERERSGTLRNDLIDTLLSIKKEAINNKDMEHFASNNDVLIAQAAAFLTAGFETSASVITFTLYELAKHPDIQKRVRSEIHEALLEGNGVLTYEKIQSLVYLDMIVNEIMRLYPVLPFLDREHIIPDNAKDGFSLEPYHNYKLLNNMPVYIPLYAIQRDEKYWPNPDQFDPERFSPSNRNSIDPSTYMPLGSGPHKCIGGRIGPLQSKLGLVHFLKNHYVSTTPKTPKNPKFLSKAVILQFNDDIHLCVSCDHLYDKVANKSKIK